MAASVFDRWGEAQGHEQTSRHVHVMSAIPLKADIRQPEWHVRLVPIADLGPRADRLL